jgi:hypothetical protein
LKKGNKRYFAEITLQKNKTIIVIFMAVVSNFAEFFYIRKYNLRLLYNI